ncbi:MAG: hypothetical protein N2Z20_03590 [Elusimicrobiales bacterium]|nr:hypothetical protein [Elusimicrobiales bacterium]
MIVDKNLPNNTKIRIKYPNGFEIEIEGNEEFVIRQKEEFLTNLTNKTPNKEINIQQDIKKNISDIIDYKNNIPYIKFKIPELDEKMAILIILLAYLKILESDRVKALNLSKSLKISGYNTKRIDTIAISLIKDNSLIAQGTKRNRLYSLTEKGLAKASVKLKNIIEMIEKNKQLD